MANFPGPFELRFTYITTASSVTREHQHRVSCVLENELEAGLDFADYNLLLRNGTPADLLATTDAYFALIDDLFTNTAEFPLVELWKYTVGTFDSQFWAAYPLAGQGASGSGAVVDSETIVTLRSQNGGIMRLQFEETIFNPAITQAFPTSVTAINNLAAYCIAPTGPFVARDNGYPIAALHYLPGSNEKFFKDRLRP